jgi:hypothetical protein
LKIVLRGNEEAPALRVCRVFKDLFGSVRGHFRLTRASYWESYFLSFITLSRAYKNFAERYGLAILPAWASNLRTMAKA